MTICWMLFVVIAVAPGDYSVLPAKDYGVNGDLCERSAEAIMKDAPGVLAWCELRADA